MNKSRRQNGDVGGEEGPLLRVILVGRSAAAGALRRDTSIELIRAREPLDAAAELITGADGEGPADARRAVVLVEPSAVPSGEEGQFLAALARADAAAPVVVLSANGVPPAWGDAVRADPDTIDGASLRRLAAARPAAAAATDSPVRTNAAAAEGLLDARGVEREELDDLACLRAVLAGADVADPCVRALRARLGDATLRLDLAERSPTPARWAEPVEHRGRRFGWLVGDGAAPPKARAAADWLGLWLALRDQHAQLRADAFIDPLTGAWNRRYFDRYLPQAIEHARKARHELSLLVFDIDDFKRFNDDHGHGVGDDILAETVRLIRATVRPEDRVCRIGGDEFAVVFYGLEGPRDPSSQHPASIAAIIARFQHQVRQQRFTKLGADFPGRLTVSGGMATFPWDAGDGPGLLVKADELALESKRQGKNTITFGAAPLRS